MENLQTRSIEPRLSAAASPPRRNNLAPRPEYEVGRSQRRIEPLQQSGSGADEYECAASQVRLISDIILRLSICRRTHENMSIFDEETDYDVKLGYVKFQLFAWRFSAGAHLTLRASSRSRIAPDRDQGCKTPGSARTPDRSAIDAPRGPGKAAHRLAPHPGRPSNRSMSQCDFTYAPPGPARLLAIDVNS
jgi:hypothetical protein